MRLAAEIKPEAEQDIALQHEWYARKAGEDVAERYLAAFRTSIEELVRQPDLGKLRHFRAASLRDVRSLSIQRPFQVHLIFYCYSATKLEVIRVLHGMRDLPRRLLGPPGEK